PQPGVSEMKLLATPTWMSARLRGRQGHARTGCGAAVARLAARLSMLGLFAATPALAAGVFFVNKSSPTCSDAGPGTEAQPYCTISGALAARGGPGTTIRVKPGLYRESVTVPVSGASGDPLIIQATGGTVNIDGAEDFSSTSLWTP